LRKPGKLVPYGILGSNPSLGVERLKSRDYPSIIMVTEIRGAEAIVRLDGDSAVKERVSKRYRHHSIDKLIISRRTKTEANILRKLRGLKGIPVIIATTKNTITMQRIQGSPLSDIKITDDNRETIVDGIVDILTELHSHSIVHGDLTPKNVIINESGTQKVSIIDFGLAQSSHRIEDKANDLWMTKETFIAHDTISDGIIKTYLSRLDEKKRALFEDRIKKMSKRGRHRSKTKKQE
jgi:Kae1-associated kinase Bud32